MTTFDYGPVEIILLGFDGERPGPAILDAIRNVVEAGTVRVLDVVFVTRGLDDGLSVMEIDELGLGEAFRPGELDSIGLAGTDDIEELAENVPPGTSAALLVVEMLWAKQLAEELYDAGGMVLRTERIPAPVVNAVFAEALS